MKPWCWPSVAWAACSGPTYPSWYPCKPSLRYGPLTNPNAAVWCFFTPPGCLPHATLMCAVDNPCSLLPFCYTSGASLYPFSDPAAPFKTPLPLPTHLLHLPHASPSRRCSLPDGHMLVICNALQTICPSCQDLNPHAAGKIRIMLGKA